MNTSVRGIRKRSSMTLGGLPLWDIAFGSDPEKGEVRGHARGIVAIGDVAAGVLALGGVARGLLAIGGVAIGVFALGGCSLGLAALGGLAVGGFAFGGCAIGVVAVGGLAVGYLACGGAAFGAHVVNAQCCDPVAADFFRRWLPWFSLTGK
ncbi:MAG: hypothetical protein GX594_08650 [Pirellulaceae bacterium]|nr:hypothetical protein [Pirellulaceae bacterium]